jgi:ABC-type sugar transport system ATPase subunit
MIEIKHLSLRLGSFSLKDINLSIKDKEYLVILGPTGAGKTILLECVAGLYKIKQGDILVDGKRVTHLTPEDRHIGYVPQDYVLFPFLNVKENIAFGLKQSRHSKIEIQERIATLASVLGISHILERDTRSLSGGEKQRVSIARALAPSSGIILLDEPFSDLDQETSKHLRLELRRIHKQLGVTTVHVTHNQIEAEELGDRIAILNCGKLEQVDEPHEIFFAPINTVVSDFIGAPNILDCDYCHTLVQGLMEVNCKGLRIIVPHDGNSIQRIALFPRDVYVSNTEPPGPQVNRFHGIITNIESSATTVKLHVKAGENTLWAEMPHDIFDDMDLSIGKEVFLILKLRRIRVYEGKNNL